MQVRNVGYELLTWIAKCLAYRYWRLIDQNVSRLADTIKFMP